MSILLVVVCVSPAIATITTVGDIDPRYDSSDPWHLLGDLIIGVDADAGMVVSDGSWVSDSSGYIAAGVGSNASVTAVVSITGDGTLWCGAGSTVVGNRGRALLMVEEGGHIHTDLITSLGAEAGGTGSVWVNGPGSALTGSTYYVGGRAAPEGRASSASTTRAWWMARV